MSDWRSPLASRFRQPLLALLLGGLASLGGCLSGTSPGGAADTADTAGAEAATDTGTSNAGCLPGYSGPDCADYDPCHADPCVHGTCTPMELAFTCACDAGYVGEVCDEPVGEVTVEVRSLAPEGIGDALWDISLEGDPGWRVRVASSLRGDGDGGFTYSGVCPAGVTATVRVALVGVYATAVPVGREGEPGGPVGDGLVPTEHVVEGVRFEREVDCAAGTPAAVWFDVVLTRPAQQGFFDRAMSAGDVFCSAKFDCCQDDGDGACTSDEVIRLLFDESGGRAPTMVLGFACTGGDATLAEPLFDDVVLDCTGTGGGSAFEADVTIAPTGGGNQCTLGPDGVSSCAVVSEAPGVDADAVLYQIATFTGTEMLETGPKLYWNMALGVRPEAIGACRLRARATGVAADSDAAATGVLPKDTVYPYIAWDVPLGACASEALWSDAVAPTYAPAASAGLSFRYHLGATDQPEAY